MSDISDYKLRFLQLVELREAYDIANKAFDKAKREYRSYEAELYEELWEAGIRGRQTFDFGGDVGRVSFTARKPTFYGSIVDKEAAIAALKKLGKDEVIYQEAVREGRLNELVRDYLESGTELPEGVGYYDRKGISISRK